MSVFVKFQGLSVVPAIRGYALESETSKKRKYSGKFEDMARFIGWDSCRDELLAIEDKFNALHSIKEKLEYKASGLSGPYKAISRRLHGGVELTLCYVSDNHLATSDTVSRKLFPGNHGQAIKHMVVQDLHEHAKANGPFTTEEGTLEFIKSRIETHFKSLESAKPASYKQDDTSEEEEDDTE